MLNPARPENLTPRHGVRVLAAMSVILAGTGLFILGAQPFAVGLFPAPWDKLAHAATFALIGAASGLASGTRGWRMAACCIAGAMAIGAMDELHQAFLPGRSATWTDLGADAAGGLLGAALLSLGYSLMRRWTVAPPTPTHH